MGKIKVNLYDMLSVHSEDSYGFSTFTPFVEPKSIEYNRDQEDFQSISVFTDANLHPASIEQDEASKKVAWLVECRELHSPAYEQIVRVEEMFDHIFTFDESLLKRGDKYVFTPIASSRIIDKHANLYKKNKLVSLIASKKKELSGHKFRHVIVNNLSRSYKMDLWGNAYRPMPEGAKVLALAEYGFSITVENSKTENYFTEKLIDCFRTGTIPIYWGCPNVEDFFDKDGILSFNDLDELEEILRNLSFEDYYKRFESVKKNFNLAKQWTCMDDTFAGKLVERCGK